MKNIFLIQNIHNLAKCIVVERWANMWPKSQEKEIEIKVYTFYLFFVLFQNNLILSRLF